MSKRLTQKIMGIRKDNHNLFSFFAKTKRKNKKLAYIYNRIKITGGYADEII
jgi:hypothetical protein